MKKIIILSIAIISLYSCSKEKTFKADAEVSAQDTLINGLVINNYKEKGLYKTFKNADNKYGIADNKGNIIVDAQFDGLEKRNDFYYMSHNANKPDILVKLNVQTKNLEALPEYVDHHLNIKEDVDVLVDKNQNLGVIDVARKIIVPFQYENFEKVGNKFFAKRSDNGSVEVYDNNLQKQILPFNLKDFILLSEKENLISATDDKNKIGILNSDLKLLAPFEYSSIVPYSYNNQYFIVSKKDNNDKPLFGIMNNKFEIVVPITYNSIDESSNEEKKLEVTQGNTTKMVDFTDFISKK